MRGSDDQALAWPAADESELSVRHGRLREFGADNEPKSPMCLPYQLPSIGPYQA